MYKSTKVSTTLGKVDPFFILHCNVSILKRRFFLKYLVFGFSKCCFHFVSSSFMVNNLPQTYAHIEQKIRNNEKEMFKH